MKRILSLILASVLLIACLFSCSDDKNKEEKPDLSKIIVAKTEHYEFTASMYAFILYGYVGQNLSYLPYYGYDTSLSLTEQTSSSPTEGKTWFEFFCEMADFDIEMFLSVAEKAYSEGVTLTEDQLAEIDKYVDELKAYAAEQGYESLDELLADQYIEGVDTEALRECTRLQQLYQSYTNKHAASLTHSKEELLNYRDSHPGEFLVMDSIQYTFYAEYDSKATDEEKEAAYEAVKTEAQTFFDTYKDAESFKAAIVALENEGKEEPDEAAAIISKFTFDAEYYDEESAEKENLKAYYEWAYSPDRNPGDTFMYEDAFYDGEKYYTVCMITQPAYVEEYVTKDCRHILFYVDTSEKDADKLAAAKSEALSKANAILDEFKTTSMTEEDFIALEKRCLEDESALEATAYYNVTLGYMVTEFENWIYGERFEGDCEIVETEYGFHVIYFIGDGDLSWEISASESLTTEIMNKYVEDAIEAFKTTFDREAITKNIK